jgi:hypothetical protein
MHDPEQRIRELMARRTPLERLQMASRMFSTARTLAAAGLGPSFSGSALREALFLRFYRADFSLAQREAILARIARAAFPPPERP